MSDTPILTLVQPPVNNGIPSLQDIAQQILDIWNRSGQARAAEYWSSKKQNSSGWSPICNNSFKDGCTKGTPRSKGGGCKREECQYRDNPALTLEILLAHMTTALRKGIYPLLEDGTTGFIAADFDNHGGTTPPEPDIYKLLAIAQNIDVPVFIFSSSSGKGFHVYIFFSGQVQASKARALMNAICRRAGILTDKSGSFDTFFPKQDQWDDNLSFGNLIALPFNGLSVTGKTSTLYLNPATLTPDSTTLEDNALDFLDNVKFMTPEELDAMLNAMQAQPAATAPGMAVGSGATGTMNADPGSGNGDAASLFALEGGGGLPPWSSIERLSRRIPDGERDVEMTSYVGWLYEDFKGDKSRVRFMAMMHNNAMCDPPLTEMEMDKIIDSIGKRAKITKLAGVMGSLLQSVEIIISPIDGSSKLRFTNGSGKSKDLEFEDVILNSTFRKKIFSLTKVVMPSMKEPQWAAIINPIVSSAPEIVESPGKTLMPALKSLIDEGIVAWDRYLKNRETDNPDVQTLVSVRLYAEFLSAKSRTAGSPNVGFICRWTPPRYVPQLYLSITQLWASVSNNQMFRGQKLEDLAKLIQGIGFAHSNYPAKIGSERYSIRAYSIPEDLYNEVKL